MGIRLYPNTQNVANLEALAGVPVGTAARLAQVEARHESAKVGKTHAELYDLEYKQWEEINDDKALGDYHHFQLYGWGKFAHIPGLTVGAGGHLDNLAHVRVLFQSNGIQADVSLTEGVHWS